MLKQSLFSRFNRNLVLLWLGGQFSLLDFLLEYTFNFGRAGKITGPTASLSPHGISQTLIHRKCRVAGQKKPLRSPLRSIVSVHYIIAVLELS